MTHTKRRQRQKQTCACIDYITYVDSCVYKTAIKLSKRADLRGYII